MTELSPILAELEKTYLRIVETYYPLCVTDTPPIISLASKGRKRTQVGWYNPEVWNDHQEDTLLSLAGLVSSDTGEVTAPTKRAEIVLATEILSDPVQTVAELARQAVIHHYVSQARAGDYRKHQLDRLLGPGGYYPRVWLNIAREVECRADVLHEQASRGWARWTPYSAFLDHIMAGVNTDVFEVSRGADVVKERVGSRMKKWTCGCTVVRCATKLQSHCDKCGEHFEWAEKEWSPFDKVPGWPPTMNYGVKDEHINKNGCQACLWKYKMGTTDPCRNPDKDKVWVGCGYAQQYIAAGSPK